ncbi:hypothetical protein M407DRAFT_86871 [Tulasnella calospora MUT 4182]|uniref:Uncharacterized protein n=1 Tax=Tulasnella calospora MUT 4182 TaxID=1051891 RepID=A0A0C3K2M4_9AGAM|nr:hypothetical protein M407DRAFT_86871 [Tulasnella calospora MUT 4182]
MCQFLEASIERRPDAYLSELANDLRDVCGLETTESTVWRALQQAGEPCTANRSFGSSDG